MAAIKKFFEKLKADTKFKKAGEGHKLTDNTSSKSSKNASSSTSAAAKPTTSPREVAPSTSSTHHVMTGGKMLGSASSSRPAEAGAKRAGEAALARLQDKKPSTALGTSDASVRLQVRREMAEEKQAMIAAAAAAAKQADSGPKEVVLDAHPTLAVSGVFYRCPLIGDEVLSKAEIEKRIEDFLYSQLPDEPELTAALMVQTFNRDADKARVGIDTLCKYLDNIIGNPDEPKYRKIRGQNKAFQERVLPLKGSVELLQAAGFERQLLPGPEGVEEEYYVLSEERAHDTSRLMTLKENLLVSEPVRPELDRNCRVFRPSQHAARVELPPEFYAHGVDDIRAQQQQRAELVEKLGMLRTKEMRERDRMRELRRYRYCLIRVRFPDGVLLQGTFKSSEPFTAVVEYVRGCLAQDWIPFTLATQTGESVNVEDTRCLAELELVPASILNFAFSEDVVKEMASQAGSVQFNIFLKEELLAAIEEL